MGSRDAAVRGNYPGREWEGLIEFNIARQAARTTYRSVRKAQDFNRGAEPSLFGHHPW
jgi:hypothetical protein